MDVISRTSPLLTSSTLNPNAPLFVPMAYRTVEDFSDEWWALVQTSPWFRDYWLEERFCDPQDDPLFSAVDDFALPDDLDSLFDDDYDQTLLDHGKEEGRGCCGDLVSIGGLKWKEARREAHAPRYAEKAPKIVNNVRVSPKTIQQPR
ncbi:protein EARLY RESPONSIVE TO DEHYDRATION 15-like [Syzygium oleosum]|uniref:protein EARLY RESPONSIVE TO DEHYDRATION 15-like n=1 Tax=Syzygium oleosum TaxID=219896 RepID=UPI0011D17EDF|nr:protein EARLY RESPONSIVE TO DEHYDRATION 15-like [Syzygium oleosum]